MEDLLDSSLDLDEIRSRVKELDDLHRNCSDEPEETSISQTDSLLRDCALQLESKVKQLVEEYSDFDLLGIEDSDAYLEYLRKELHSVEAEGAKVSEEIERLSRTHVEDSSRLERDLEGLLSSLDYPAFQDVEKGKDNPLAGCSTCKQDQPNFIDADGAEKFKNLELDKQIQEKKMVLKSLEELDLACKRFDAAEQVEDALTGLKVLEFDGNAIRLQLKTCIPKLDGLIGQNIMEDIPKPSEVNHELLIEIVDKTMELKHVEMFPNDLYIGDIVAATKSFRQISVHSAVLYTRSSLEWFVGKLQERIMLSTIRKYVVKSLKQFRHTFEYFDGDEMIVAHLGRGIDAFIKVSLGWPLLNAPLKLVSIKNSDHHSNKISLSLMCKVEELANSMDLQTRQSLSEFTDAIEKVTVEQMRLELHSKDTA